MNGHGISEYPAKTRKYGVFTLSFIIVIGMGFCYVDLFTDAGWKSKWYWLYTAVSVCSLSFFLTGAGRPETGKTFRIGLPDCLLAALVLYCLSRAAAGQFAEAFLMRCTAFLPIYCLAGRVVRNRSFEPLSAAVAASALLLALYGIAQYAGLLPAGKTFRVVGNFDNPAGYASMLALSVPFILYFALSGRRRMRYAVGVVCAIVVGAIVLSGSRTGILAVAATGLLYAVRRRSDFLRRTTDGLEENRTGSNGRFRRGRIVFHKKRVGRRTAAHRPMHLGDDPRKTADRTRIPVFRSRVHAPAGALFRTESRKRIRSAGRQRKTPVQRVSAVDRRIRSRRPAADGAVDRKPDPGLSEKPERRIAHARDGTVGRGGALLFCHARKRV